MFKQLVTYLERLCFLNDGSDQDSMQLYTYSTFYWIAHFVELFLIHLPFIFVVDALQPTVSGEPWADIGTDTTLRCTASDTFTRLEWRNSSLDETGFDTANILVRYTVPDQVIIFAKTHYLFDKNDPDYPLTITSHTLDDEARYWCTLETDRPRGAFIDIQVRGESCTSIPYT